MEEFEGDSDEFEGDPEDLDFEGYPEDFEDYPEGFDLEHFEDGQSLFEAGQGHFEGGQGHFEAGQEHFMSGQGHFEDSQGHFEEGQEHFEEGLEHFEDDEDQFEDDQEHFVDGQEHFEDGHEQFENGHEHFEGDQEYELFESEQEPAQGGQRHFHGRQEHFESGQEQAQGGQRFFQGGQEHFQHYEDFEDEDEDFDEDFDEEEEDFEFECDQGGLILPDNRMQSSSGFQNSYNKYIMSQYHHSEDIHTDDDDHVGDVPEDMDHESEHEKLADRPGTRNTPAQKSVQLQPVSSTQQECQMRLPLHIYENHELSPAPSNSTEPPGGQEKVDQAQQEEVRAIQQPHRQNPSQHVSRGHAQQADRMPRMQAKPQRQQLRAVSEVTVTSHNVSVSTYNHQRRSELSQFPKQCFPRVPSQFPRMPNQGNNNLNRYRSPGHGVRYVVPGHRQGARRNWHIPHKEQPSHAYQHGRQQRQQVSSSELSEYHDTEHGHEEGEQHGYLPQQEQPAMQDIRQRFPQHPPNVRMRGSVHSNVGSTPRDSWHTPRDSSKSPLLKEHSSQGLIHGSQNVSAQNSPKVSGQHSSPVLQRRGSPQVIQNSPRVMAQGCPPGSSGASCHQGESKQGEGKQLCTEQNNLSQEMKKMFNLPSQPRVIVQGDRRAQNLQENTYYSVQRCSASSTASNDGPVAGSRVQQRLNTTTGNRDGSGSSSQGQPSRIPNTSINQRSEQGGSAPSATTNSVNTPDSTTTHASIEHPADSSNPTTTSQNHNGSKCVTDSVNKNMVGSFLNDPMNGHMDNSFDPEMMGYEEDYDEDEEDFDEDDDDDDEYFDEEEELEHDAVMREMEMEGSHSPPPLPVGVPRRSGNSEAWPTPLSSLNQKKVKAESEPGAAGVEFVSSSSQRACNSPVFGFTPACVHQECTPSSPGPAQDSHLTPLEPVQPAIPPHTQLGEQEGCPKRPLADDEEGTILCKYCESCSKNLEACEGCQRSFPPDVNVFIKKRKIETPDSVYERERTCGGGKVNPAPSEAGFSIEKRMFYGTKTLAQGESYSDDEDCSGDNFVIRSTERTYSRLHGSGTCAPNQHKFLRGVKEPVTVTISSDEDEAPSNEREPQSSSKSVSAKPVPATTVTTTAAAVTTAPATLTSTTAVQEKDDGFFSSPVPKPTSTFGLSRRSRMEDATGRCNPRPRSPFMRFGGEGVYFHVRGVRIGSMRTSGLEVRFMTRSIAFTVISDRTQEELDFFVYVADIRSISFILKPPQPVAFLHVTPGCGTRLRSHLKMVSSSPEYFDPGSQDPQKNKIVIIIETMSDEAGLRDMFCTYRKNLKIDNFLKELGYEEANNLLVSSTPPILANSVRSLPFGDAQPCSASPSSGNQHEQPVIGRTEGEEENLPMSMSGDTGLYPPEDYDGYDEYEDEEEGCPPSPYYGFVGPVEKLLTYPPAPAKGGITITNEDLFCLNEGEFLNDVILDFYLKYLFLEKLSEEDRQRTHIFSSFFFKRLTQKSARCVQDQEAAKLTLQERRHSRVRTWTRQVDIFSKDFLLIPINENAHWFLAIVCFPSLVEQEYVSFQPSPLCEPEETTEQPTDAEPTSAQQPEKKEEGEAEEEEDPDSSPDMPSSSTCKEDCVLGKVIPSDTALQGQPSDYKVGLKQACILVMDSLMGPSRNSIIRILKEYLQVEWDRKKGTPNDIMKNVRGACPHVPQQNNFSDCGVYVLQYAESFFDNPIANFSLPMKLECWFPRSQVERKREEIHDLILSLQAELTNR